MRIGHRGAADALTPIAEAVNAKALALDLYVADFDVAAPAGASAAFAAGSAGGQQSQSSLLLAPLGLVVGCED